MRTAPTEKRIDGVVPRSLHEQATRHLAWGTKEMSVGGAFLAFWAAPAERQAAVVEYVGSLRSKGAYDAAVPQHVLQLLTGEIPPEDAEEVAIRDRKAFERRTR